MPSDPTHRFGRPLYPRASFQLAVHCLLIASLLVASLTWLPTDVSAASRQGAGAPNRLSVKTKAEESSVSKQIDLQMASSFTLPPVRKEQFQSGAYTWNSPSYAIRSIDPLLDHRIDIAALPNLAVEAATTTYYIGAETLPPVSITKPSGIATWVYGNTFGTTRDLAVGLVFHAVAIGGSNARMSCSYAGCNGAANMWGNTSDQLQSWGTYYCTSSPRSVCDTLAPGAYYLGQSYFTSPKPAGTFLAGGFKTGWAKTVSSSLYVYGIHFLYSGTPPPQLDRSSLSGCGISGGGSAWGGSFGIGGGVPGGSGSPGGGGGGNGDCDLNAGGGANGGAGDPINTRTGSFLYNPVDLTLDTVAGPMTFQRFYASQATEVYTATSSLGYGWTHNQELRLLFGPGAIWFKANTANQYKFIDNGNGTYLPYAGVLASLTYNAGSGTYTVTSSQQKTYHFDSGGQLTHWRNAEGFGFDYTYTGGALTRVSEPLSGRFLDLAYQNGRLASVTDHTGRQIGFGYNPAGDVASFTDVMGETWIYLYTDPGFPHHLSEIRNPLSQLVLENEYDASGRAVHQYDGLGNALVDLVYNGDGTTSLGQLVDGEVVTATHQYDDRNTLVAETNLAGSLTKSYAPSFRPGTLLDPLGRSTTYQWSTDGSTLNQIDDAAGNTTRMGYDGLNNLTSIVDSRGYTTTFSYNGSLLVNQVDPLGNTTVYTYTTGADAPQPAGLLKAARDPNSLLTHYAYDSSGQLVALTDAQGRTSEYAYDSLGRLITTTDPQGRDDWTCYDPAGRVTRRVGNALWSGSGPDPCDPDYVPSTNPEQDRIHETQYDFFGNTIASVEWEVAPGGVITHTTRSYYDPIGRVTHVARNLHEWDIASSTPPPLWLRTDEFNLTTQTVYDTSGLPVASLEWVVEGSQVFTRTMRLYYDALGRLEYTVQNLSNWPVSTATPPPLELRTADQNITQRKYHDAKGNLIAAEDAAGRITRTYYDLLDRPYLVVRNWSGADLYSPTPPACNRYEGATTNICSETFYDPGSNAIASRDERGFFTRTYYDADNQPAWVVRNLTYQSYEVAAPPPTTAFGNDHDIAFQTVYDAGGRAIAQVDWWVVDGQVASRTTRTYFNALGQAYLTVQNLDPAYPLGNETPPTCNRDQSGAAPPYNICLETRYDPASGLAIASLDPLGRVTRTYFDALDRPYLSVRNLTAQDYSVETPPPASAFGNDQNVAAQTIYDRRGRAMARVEWWLEDSQVISRTMRTHYDSLGRTVSVVSNFAGDLAAGTPPDFDPASPDRNLRADTHYASDGRAIAQVEWSVDATGQAYARTTRLYADALGRAVQVVQNLDPAWGYQNPSPPPCNRDTTGQGSTYNVCSQTVYDELGQATAQIDALGKATIYQYNSLSQLVAVTDPLTRTLQYGYDAAGNRVSSMDANGVAMRFEYDPLGQLAAVVENYRPGFAPDHETNVRTEYSYDALGNRLTIRDGNDHVTTSTYDSLGRLASERDPLDHTWQQRYDVAGRRVAQTNANGATIAYGYDGLDRLASIDYPAPQADVTFAYNALGWRTSMSDGVGGTQWIYDRLGRALSVTDPFFSTVSYAYNPSGGRTALTYPGGGMVSYQYDALERLARVIAPATTVTYTHDVAGRLLSTSLDNGLVSEYDYDDAGQLLGLAHRRGGETLSSFGYSYDPAGNRAQAQEWLLQPAPASPYSTTISYDYDPLYRLTAADYSSGEYFHYSYDPVGNRLSETTPGGVITSTYDVANRLSSVGGTSYTWDDNGNLLGDGVNTYTFDHANRLTGVTNQQSSISYAYNGLGDRIQQTADSVTTNFTLDLVAGLTQVLADGTNTYLYGMGRIAQVGSNGAEYFLGDALSSVRQLTSANGDITLSHAYEPFGEVTGSAGQGITSFGFAGEWATALEGIDLTYLRARWYAPGIGKFTSRDTWRGSSIMPASYNLWLYAYNNPVKLFDPSGLKPTEPEIREGRHVYSCNCGWIDFDHADPRKSEQIFLMLNARPSAPRNMPVTDGVYVITLYMSLLGLQPSVNAVTKTGLGQDLKNAVALGIFMDLEQYIERLQSLYPPSRSSFSEEDLASDLIGFYMNTLGVMSSARVNDESWNWLADTCGFPKDRQEAMEWSVEVFNTYPEFEQVKKWGTPRLVCTPGIGAGCFGSRGWPDVFSTILPQKSSPSGNWWWYRGVRDDGFLAVSNLQGIYFLINP